MVLKPEPTDRETAQKLGWQLRDACAAGNLEEIIRVLHVIDTEVLITPEVDKKTSLSFYVRKTISTPVVDSESEPKGTQAFCQQLLEKLQNQKTQASQRAINSFRGSPIAATTSKTKVSSRSSQSSTGENIDILCYDARRGLDFLQGHIPWEDVNIACDLNEPLSQVIAKYRGIINDKYRHPLVPITNLIVYLNDESKPQHTNDIPASLILKNLKEQGSITGQIRIGFQASDDTKALNSLWRHSTELKTPVWSPARLTALPTTWISSTPDTWIKPESEPSPTVVDGFQYFFKATPTLAFAPPQIAPFPHPKTTYPPVIASHIDIILTQPIPSSGAQDTDLGEFTRIAYFSLDKAAVPKNEQFVPPLNASQARRLLGRMIQWRRPTSKREADHDDVLSIGYAWGIDLGDTVTTGASSSSDDGSSFNGMKLFILNSQERRPMYTLDLTAIPSHDPSIRPPKSDTNSEKIQWVGIIPLPGSDNATSTQTPSNEMSFISKMQDLIKLLREKPAFEVIQGDTIIVGDAHILRSVESFPVHIPNAKPGIWISHISMSAQGADVPASMEVHFHKPLPQQSIYTDLESLYLTPAFQTPGEDIENLPWVAVGSFGADAGGAGILAQSAFLPGGVCHITAEQSDMDVTEPNSELFFETVGLAATDSNLTYAAVPGGVVCTSGIGDGIYRVYARFDEAGVVIGVKVPFF